MGLFGTPSPGSLLKPPADVKAIDPPKKEFGTVKPAKGGDKKAKQAEAEQAAEAPAADD